MPRRTGRSALILALGLSLVLHLSALGLARAIGEGGLLAVTESRSPHDQPQPEPQPPEPPEEDPFTPGIEEGAKAVVTWIGYEEYEEHLAQLAETDQAAFTSALARGVPEAPSEAPSPSEQISQATSEPIPPTAAPPTSSQDEQPEPIEAAAEIAAAEQEAQAPRTEAVEVAVDPAPQPKPEPRFEPSATEAPAIEPFESNPSEPVEAEPIETEPSPAAPENQSLTDPMRVPLPLAVLQPVRRPPPSAPHGEPTPVNAAPSERESTPTSTRDVPEIEWNNGKPIAREGLEIRPFSLERHIMLDSRDVLFGQQLNRGGWAGRVRRNPIVSIRFDRHGRVADVRIIRPSGFKPLDEQYLASWMARWTATGPRLNDLGPGQLTSPIQFRLIFIDEPRPAMSSQSNSDS